MRFIRLSSNINRAFTDLMTQFRLENESGASALPADGMSGQRRIAYHAN
jgi:hypothetical protein